MVLGHRGGGTGGPTGASPPSFGVARVGPVYTPPAQRGRGWASNAVAGISRRIQAEGSRVCLFTDQANPTSNKIYTALGYQPVADMANLVIALLTPTDSQQKRTFTPKVTLYKHTSLGELGRVCSFMGWAQKVEDLPQNIGCGAAAEGFPRPHCGHSHGEHEGRCCERQDGVDSK